MEIIIHIAVKNNLMYVTLNILPDPEANSEANDMLTRNAENLISTVEELLFCTEAATIQLPPSEMKRLGLDWVKKTD